MNIFQSIDDHIQAPLNAFITTGVANVASAISGPFKTATLLYVMLFGLAIVVGRSSASMSEFMNQVFKLCIITMLIQGSSNLGRSTGSAYQEYVVDLFFKTLPGQLADALNVQSGQPSINGGHYSIGQSFDTVLNNVAEKISQMWKNSSYFEIGFYLNIIGFIFTIVSIAYGFVVALQAEVALSVLMAIGPIFIALYLFQATREFTGRWLGQVLNFVILQVLTVVLSVLTASIFTNFISAMGGSGSGSIKRDYAIKGGGAAVVYSSNLAADAMATSLGLVCIAVVIIYLYSQLPHLASSLAGGMALHVNKASRAIVGNPGAMIGTVAGGAVGAAAGALFGSGAGAGAKKGASLGAKAGYRAAREPFR